MSIVLVAPFEEEEEKRIIKLLGFIKACVSLAGFTLVRPKWSRWRRRSSKQQQKKKTRMRLCSKQTRHESGSSVPTNPSCFLGAFRCAICSADADMPMTDARRMRMHAITIAEMHVQTKIHACMHGGESFLRGIRGKAEHRTEHRTEENRTERNGTERNRDTDESNRLKNA